MKNSQRLFEPNTRPFVFFLIVFAVATLVLKNYYLAAAEGVVILGLLGDNALTQEKGAACVYRVSDLRCGDGEE